jgi:hypothetical protein
MFGTTNFTSLKSDGTMQPCFKVHVGPCLTGFYTGTIGSINNAINVRVSREEKYHDHQRERQLPNESSAPYIDICVHSFSPTCDDNELIIQSRNLECIQYVILCVLKALADSLFCTWFRLKFVGGYRNLNKRFWVAFEVDVAWKLRVQHCSAKHVDCYYWSGPMLCDTG